MKPQFANMTLEEFMKEMEPYMTPDKYDHLSSEELQVRAAEFRMASRRLRNINKMIKEGIDNNHG